MNWEAYGQHCLHGDILRRWIGEPDSLEQLIRDSQEYQAFHLKYHTEFYRRHKFRPCNGALFFQFKDCWPAVTAAVVDYYGRPKRAYSTLKQAFNPIHVMMDWPPLAGEPAGSTFRKDLFVVNDYYHPYPAVHVKWQIRDASGAPLLEHEVPCSIAANSLTKVADVAWAIRRCRALATASPSSWPPPPSPCPPTSTASPSRASRPSPPGAAGFPEQMTTDTPAQSRCASCGETHDETRRLPEQELAEPENSCEGHKYATIGTMVDYATASGSSVAFS